MLWNRSLATLTVVILLLVTSAARCEISGHYMESRTCQVYTGPCFANAEVGLAGKEAVMAWRITEGTHNGIDLSGLSVVMALQSTKTLGFQGIEGAGDVRSVILVDDTAKGPRRDALIDFAKTHSGKAGHAVVRIDDAPIAMSLDEFELKGKLSAGKAVQLETRRARPDDCICSNESAYYPPLAELANFAPGVTTVGEFKGRGLGASWSTPGARSAYVAKFAY
ncbi:MAG: DUF1326 domain-containing protein [Planctomycetaceae bacterium]|nr:DUF1326 domain-containing protein [Planctomycetales bacterium]MCB9923310.1 DUF1326 domain-containing protein [Planctomycetaceae bacterium]